MLQNALKRKMKETARIFVVQNGVLEDNMNLDKTNRQSPEQESQVVDGPLIGMDNLEKVSNMI